MNSSDLAASGGNCSLTNGAACATVLDSASTVKHPTTLAYLHIRVPSGRASTDGTKNVSFSLHANKEMLQVRYTGGGVWNEVQHLLLRFTDKVVLAIKVATAGLAHSQVTDPTHHQNQILGQQTRKIYHQPIWGCLKIAGVHRQYSRP